MSNFYNSTLVNNILKEFQGGNKQNAYSKLEAYIKQNPKDKTAVYNFAYMSELLGNIDTAVENYFKIFLKFFFFSIFFNAQHELAKLTVCINQIWLAVGAQKQTQIFCLIQSVFIP